MIADAGSSKAMAEHWDGRVVVTRRVPVASC